MSNLERYLGLAHDWCVAMEAGDSRAANELHDRVQRAFEELCAAHEEGALFDLAGESSDGVCFFIASHLKERDEPRAAALYSRLALSPVPFVAVSAKYILKEMGRS